MRRMLIVLSAVSLLAVAGLVSIAAAKLPQSQGFSIAVQLEDTTPNGQALADYLYDLPSGAHWLAGDRPAYHCAYTFLEHNGALVGRVAFHRVTSAASYAQINDRYMAEGIYYYDGEYDGPGGVDDTSTRGLENTSTADACHATITYDDLAGSPGPLPVIQFVAPDTSVIETRNYANVQVVGDLQFGMIDVTADHATVVIYRGATAVAVVYYDALALGYSLATNGGPIPTTTTPPPTTSPPTTTTPPPAEVCESHTFFEGTAFEVRQTACHD